MISVHARATAGPGKPFTPTTIQRRDFCGEHGIGAVVEVFHADHIDRAYDRLTTGDVRFRFVIDISTMTHG